MYSGISYKRIGFRFGYSENEIFKGHSFKGFLFLFFIDVDN